MTRRGGKNRTKPNRYNCGNGMFWQSPNHNRQLVTLYRNIIMQMAMSRFRWVNLPETCDARFLEYTLLTEGVATILHPKGQPNVFYSTRCVFDSEPNVYNDYTKWRSVGNNGWSIYGSRENGVLVWDNSTRFPLMEGINIYAQELAHITITKEINRFHQQIPWILTGPNERKQDMVNLSKQVIGGEIAVLGLDSMDSIDVKNLSLAVPFLGNELSQDEKNVWNRVFTMLGVANSTLKMERQTQDEIESQQMPTTLVRSSSLECRREAANYLNSKFGTDISVVWYEDNESRNFNFVTNLQAVTETL